MNYFNNKWVWVTGASQGMGKEFALQLHEAGAHLVISSRKEADLLALKGQLKSGPDVEIVALDLNDQDALAMILEENKSILEKVDVLINNAGISQRSITRESDFIVYERLMSVNYLGTVMISLFMLDIFDKKGHGHFATLSSVAGIFPVPYRSGYSAAKMALYGFFESFRAENENKDIHITMLYPGFVKTDISKHSLTGDGSQLGTMDDAQANAMSASYAVEKMLKAIADKKHEFKVGGFKETVFGPLVYRLFPKLFKKIIKKTKVR